MTRKYIGGWIERKTESETNNNNIIICALDILLSSVHLSVHSEIASSIYASFTSSSASLYGMG